MYGGSSRTTVSAVRLIKQAALERRVDDRRGRPIDLDAPHHAGAADVARPPAGAPRARAAPRSRCAPIAATCAMQAAAQLVEEHQRGAAGEQVAAVGAAVVAGAAAAATRSENIAAPIGTPPPSALPSAIRSGCRPSVG